jgi:hypothetical protein
LFQRGVIIMLIFIFGNLMRFEILYLNDAAYVVLFDLSKVKFIS